MDQSLARNSSLNYDRFKAPTEMYKEDLERIVADNGCFSRKHELVESIRKAVDHGNYRIKSISNAANCNPSFKEFEKRLVELVQHNTRV